MDIQKKTTEDKTKTDRRENNSSLPSTIICLLDLEKCVFLRFLKQLGLTLQIATRAKKCPLLETFIESIIIAFRTKSRLPSCFTRRSNLASASKVKPESPNFTPMEYFVPLWEKVTSLWRIVNPSRRRIERTWPRTSRLGFAQVFEHSDELFR